MHKEEVERKKVQITDSNGEEYVIPVEGSLGLLALGYIGLEAWRNKYRTSKKQDEER